MYHPTRQYRHLAHVPSFRDNLIVFVTTGTHQRQKLLANTQCHEILREMWEKSAAVDGWCVGHYFLRPDHVHLFARPAVDARAMADWIKMWKSISLRKIVAALATSPAIWQADYFDRYLGSGENYF
jgi:putative transposase